MSLFKFILLFALLTITGCFAKPGQMKESDFNWQEKIIQANYQEVYRNVKAGFRTCGGEENIDGDLYTDIQEGAFVVYHPGGLVKLGQGMTRVTGKINIKGQGDTAALIRVGVNTYDDNWPGSKGVAHLLWLRWASGEATCEY